MHSATSNRSTMFHRSRQEYSQVGARRGADRSDGGRAAPPFANRKTLVPLKPWREGSAPWEQRRRKTAIAESQLMLPAMPADSATIPKFPSARRSDQAHPARQGSRIDSEVTTR